MPPIAETLELDRLRYREARLMRALTVLEARVARLESAGIAISPALTSALEGFRGDLDQTRARLR